MNSTIATDRLCQKKITGFDRKLRVWRDEIFFCGFEAGAKARVVAGILSPPGKIPKRSVKIPRDYSDLNARTLWAYAWRAGYAIASPNTPSGTKKMRRRSLVWKQMLRKRGPLRPKKQELVGCWRASRGEYIKLWNLAQDGSATGRITKARTVVADASGTWKLHRDCLILDFRQDLLGGEMNAPYEVTSVVMDITRDRLVIATSETIRERFIRVRQRI
jgi:hypothetical protein